MNLQELYDKYFAGHDLPGGEWSVFTQWDEEGDLFIELLPLGGWNEDSSSIGAYYDIPSHNWAMVADLAEGEIDNLLMARHFAKGLLLFADFLGALDVHDDDALEVDDSDEEDYSDEDDTDDIPF